MKKKTEEIIIVDNREMLKNEYDMLYLTVCALNDTVPDKGRLDKMDMDGVLKTSRKHSLSGLCAFALEKAGVMNDAFLKEKLLSVRKVMRLDAERKRILGIFEEKGIWYMPLKGVFMKEYYPQLGMRVMCDNDILIDSTRIDEITEIMEKDGYERSADATTHDIGFYKKPEFNYEMHVGLVGKYHDKKWYEYYRNIKERLIKDEDNCFGYHFTNEDFYIFMTLHEYKHYIIAGTGLRSLADVYVFLRKFKNELDFDYLNNELQKLGIDEFEKASRSLAIKLFSSIELPEFSNKEQEMFDYYLSSGTYGNKVNFVKNKKDQLFGENAEVSKAEYLWRRLFPPMEHYKKFFPFFYKHTILLPVGWGYRLFRMLIFGRKRFVSEMMVIRKK